MWIQEPVQIDGEFTQSMAVFYLCMTNMMLFNCKIVKIGDAKTKVQHNQNSNKQNCKCCTKQQNWVRKKRGPLPCI